MWLWDLMPCPIISEDVKSGVLAVIEMADASFRRISRWSPQRQFTQPGTLGLY